MSPEELRALAQLVENHPGPYALGWKDGAPERLFTADGELSAHLWASSHHLCERLAGLEALVTRANAVPELLRLVQMAPAMAPELAAALEGLVAVRAEIADDREAARHLQGPRPIRWELNRLEYAITAVEAAYRAQQPPVESTSTAGGE